MDKMSWTRGLSPEFGWVYEIMQNCSKLKGMSQGLLRVYRHFFANEHWTSEFTGDGAKVILPYMVKLGCWSWYWLRTLSLIICSCPVTCHVPNWGIAIGSRVGWFDEKMTTWHYRVGLMKPRKPSKWTNNFLVNQAARVDTKSHETTNFSLQYIWVDRYIRQRNQVLRFVLCPLKNLWPPKVPGVWKLWRRIKP